MACPFFNGYRLKRRNSPYFKEYSNMSSFVILKYFFCKKSWIMYSSVKWRSESRNVAFWIPSGFTPIERKTYLRLKSLKHLIGESFNLYITSYVGRKFLLILRIFPSVYSIRGWEVLKKSFSLFFQKINYSSIFLNILPKDSGRLSKYP